MSDDLFHRARVVAAQQRTTLSALVRRFLEGLTEAEPAFDRLRREQNELIAMIRTEYPGRTAADRLSRTEVHERDAVR